MKQRKKFKEFRIIKHIISITLAFMLIFSTIFVLNPSKAFAAKTYNPAGRWMGTDEMAGGMLEISMYSDPEGKIVGNWELSNMYGHSEGIIKKTSTKNKYKLVYAFMKDEKNAGDVYFIMKMKSNKKLQLIPKAVVEKSEWKNTGYSGKYKLTERFRS